MTKILAALAVIKEIIAVIGQIMGLIKKAKIKKAEERNEALQKAAEDSKVAKTDQEVIDAQNRVVDNK